MIDEELDTSFMRQALRQAQKAFEAEEVPVGAVIVQAGRIIGRAYNQVELLKDATAHAEMLAITQAEAAIGDWRLNECDLYVTKEPCVMCAGAVVHVRMRRVIFGCGDERSGAAGGMMNVLQTSALNHRCQITSGVLQQECASLLHSFFRARRAQEQAIAAGEVNASASLRRKRLQTGDAPNDEGNAE
jgi:tRNA(adenine34) deaminase